MKLFRKLFDFHKPVRRRYIQENIKFSSFVKAKTIEFSDLFKPKWKHSDWKVRIVAIEKVTDQNILADIAKKDKTSSVRKAGIEKVTDQKVLVEVAKNDEDEWVRAAAIKKVTNQKIRSQLAKMHEEKTTVLKKVKKIYIFTLKLVSHLQRLGNVVKPDSVKLKYPEYEIVTKYLFEPINLNIDQAIILQNPPEFRDELDEFAFRHNKISAFNHLIESDLGFSTSELDVYEFMYIPTSSSFLVFVVKG